MDTRDAEFTAFVRARGPALSRTAWFLSGDPHLAEDLVQTALAETYVRWHSIRGEAEPYARKALVSANAAWWRRRSASEVPVHATPDAADPYDTAELAAERLRVVAALRRLPAKQRAALVLRFYDDLSEADTARALGCAPGSVKRHVSRGLDKLRRALGEEPALGHAAAHAAPRPAGEAAW